MIKRNPVKNGESQSRNLSEEKTLPEYKYSVTFNKQVEQLS